MATQQTMIQVVQNNNSSGDEGCLKVCNCLAGSALAVCIGVIAAILLGLGSLLVPLSNYMGWIKPLNVGIGFLVVGGILMVGSCLSCALYRRGLKPDNKSPKKVPETQYQNQIMIAPSQQQVPMVAQLQQQMPMINPAQQVPMMVSGQAMYPVQHLPMVVPAQQQMTPIASGQAMYPVQQQVPMMVPVQHQMSMMNPAQQVPMIASGQAMYPSKSGQVEGLAQPEGFHGQQMPSYNPTAPIMQTSEYSQPPPYAP